MVLEIPINIGDVVSMLDFFPKTFNFNQIKNKIRS